MSPSLATASLRLNCLERDGRVVGYGLEARVGDGWRLMARCEPLARLVYRDGAGERHEVELAADSWQESADSLSLSGGFVDGDGVSWRQSVTVARVAQGNQLNMACRLESSAPRQVLYWSGPRLLAGEGSFGAAREEALFPGLEYLLDDEPSSDTRFAAGKFAERSVPHPYQITIPMMAVSHEGCGVGLLWDPNQNWGSAWRHPAARFSSPNRHEGGARQPFDGALRARPLRALGDTRPDRGPHARQRRPRQPADAGGAPGRGAGRRRLRHPARMAGDLRSAAPAGAGGRLAREPRTLRRRLPRRGLARGGRGLAPYPEGQLGAAF